MVASLQKFKGVMFTLQPAHVRANRAIWAMIVGFLALDFGWMLATGLSADFSRAVFFFYVLAGCAGLSVIYRYFRKDDLLYMMGQLTNQLLVSIVALGIFSYLTQRLALPLVDDTLIAIDRFFFFEWKDYVAWVDRHVWLARLFSIAYFSSGPQIMCIIALLFVYKQIGHIQRYIFAFFFTAMATIIFAAIFPAVAGYIYYDIDIAVTYQNLRPAAGRIHEAPVMALRDHSMTILKFPLEGIVTFPSFHTALAVLLVYASSPIRWLYRIALPLNILVLFSTPVDGGHWAVDVVGGVAIALMGIWVAKKIWARLEASADAQR